MIHFTAAKSGESAEIAKGESFEIDLPENPSTGFVWRVEAAGEPVCALTNDDFHPSRGVGGEGSHHWRFRATKPGRSEIALRLQRSWNAAEPAESFNLCVLVTA